MSRKSLLTKRFVFLVLIIVLCCSSVSSISATSISYRNTFYVDDDNTQGPWDGTQEHPYQYIQDAVNNSDDGDTIFVYSGIYYESLFIDKSLELIGEDKNSTIIDGNRNSIIVWINHSDVRTTGFTIRNSEQSGFGQAIFIKSKKCNSWFNNIYIYNCIFTNCGKGIYGKFNSNAIIENCSFKYNIAQSILFEEVINLSIKNCSMYSNGNKLIRNSIMSGGIDIVNEIGYNYSIVKIINCCIYNNIGSGIDIRGHICCDIKNNTIFNNSEEGVRLSGYVTFNISYNTIYGNLGEGIRIYLDSKGTIYKNIVYRNGFGDFYGNGIYIVNCPLCISINNNIIFSNHNAGIYLIQSINDTIEDNDISNNSKGILIGSGSENILLLDNYVNNNYYGIYISHSSENNIGYNTITDNTEGLRISDSSSNNNITYNLISKNNDGVIIQSTNQNIIFKNNIIENDRGIYLDNSPNNNILLNNFIMNKKNAYFIECNNKWEKNYWNKSRILPYCIRGDIILYGPLTRWKHVYIPILNFDWHPSFYPTLI